MNLEKLKKIRKECGYSQQEIASMFGYTRQNFGQKEQTGKFKLSEIKELKQILSLTNDEIYEIFID